MMILGFPSNPTAQCVELDFFERVVALAKQYDVLVVHDLAYADIVYDGWKAPSIMQVPGAKTSRWSSSPSQELQHGRLAHRLHGRQPELVSGPGAHQELSRLRQFTCRCRWRPSPRWRATSSACGDRGQYQSAATCWSRAARGGLDGRNPKASMYVWAKIPRQYHTWVRWFAKLMLAEAKVCVSPGIGFGDYGDDHVRFALIENEAHPPGHSRHSPDVPG
jgi:alanine-synthesizing transaminase